MYGHAKAPWWIVPMEIAKRWNTSPVKIIGGSRTLWYVRECAIRDAEIKRTHKLEMDAKRQQMDIESNSKRQR